MSTPEEAITPEDLDTLRDFLFTALSKWQEVDERTEYIHNLPTVSTNFDKLDRHYLVNEVKVTLRRALEATSDVEAFAKKIRFDFEDFIHPKVKTLSDDEWDAYLHKEYKVFGFQGLMEAVVERAKAHRQEQRKTPAASYTMLEYSCHRETCYALAIVGPETITGIIDGVLPLETSIADLLDPHVMLIHLFNRDVDFHHARKVWKEDQLLYEANRGFRDKLDRAVHLKLKLEGRVEQYATDTADSPDPEKSFIDQFGSLEV